MQLETTKPPTGRTSNFICVAYRNTCPAPLHCLHISPFELPIAELCLAVVGPIQWCFPNVCFTFAASSVLPARAISLLWLLDDENVPQSLLCLGLDLVLLWQREQRADLALGLLQGSAGTDQPFRTLFKPEGFWLGSVVSHLQRDSGTSTTV